MTPSSASSTVPITLRLPGGERYRVEVDAEDLAGRLGPGRKAPREFGMAPVMVEVQHSRGQHPVPVSPGELIRLLSRARFIDYAPAGQVARRASGQQPEGRSGPSDQPANRLGLTGDAPSGPSRHRRPP